MFADKLRIREQPKVSHIDEKILEDLGKLLPLRDQLVDWMLLETSIKNDSVLDDVLQDFLEKLLALIARPPEITAWSESWFDAHRIFVYEMFLYLIAVLNKNSKFVRLVNLDRDGKRAALNQDKVKANYIYEIKAQDFFENEHCAFQYHMTKGFRGIIKKFPAYREFGNPMQGTSTGNNKNR